MDVNGTRGKLGKLMAANVTFLAAGAGLVTSGPAEAAIIVNGLECPEITKDSNSTCDIDLNLDQQVDFRVAGQGDDGYGGGLGIQVYSMGEYNAVLLSEAPIVVPGQVGTQQSLKNYAAALSEGTPIGVEGQIWRSYGWMEGAEGFAPGSSSFTAPWDNVPAGERRFLGLSLNFFTDDPQFAWVEVLKGSVDPTQSGLNTIPGQAICAGQTDPGPCPTQQVPVPGSVILLAAGASAILALRRFRRDDQEETR